MPKALTHVSTTITDPVPSTGEMTFDDSGKLRVVFDLDLSQLIAHYVLTKEVPDISAAIGNAMVALIKDMAPRFVAGYTLSQKADAVTH